MRSLAASINASRRAAAFTKRRKQPEFAIHAQIVDYLSIVLPPSVWFTTFPAGEKRDSRGGARLKRLRMRRGVPDVLLIHNGILHGIEIKAPGEKLSLAQEQTHMDMVFAGARVTVVHSLDAAIAWLKSYRVPLNAWLAQ